MWYCIFMINHEQLAEILLEPLVTNTIRLADSSDFLENQIGEENLQLLLKNLDLLQSNDWQEKEERALASGRVRIEK